MTTPARLYLLDVEGTVAPLSLVSEQLFPYARAHFESFLWDSVKHLEKEPQVSEASLSEGSVFWDLAMLGMESRAEQDQDAPRPFEPGVTSMSPAVAIPRILAYVNWIMDRDRKSTALKSLQGKVWKAGFEAGELKGTLFADVPAAFERWSQQAKVAIYSSGSVEAQQLLLRYSTYGDLTPLISDYFDTRIGPKSESASYSAIAEELQIEPEGAIFFSDVVRELDAARSAGLATRLVVREGNATVEDPHGHEIITSFEGL